MTITNSVYKGIILFLTELKKHLEANTAGKFWRELGGRTAWQIHYTYKDIKHDTLYELIEWIKLNHADITPDEWRFLLNDISARFWVLESKSFFMLETIELDNEQDADDAEDEPVEFSPVAPAEDSLKETLPVKSLGERQAELKALSIPELREILKGRNVPYPPAGKVAKLVELVMESDPT